MRLIRAIVFGIFLWLLIFVEVSSLIYAFGIEYPSDLYFITHFAFLILFTLVCGLGYFWVPKIRAGFVHGLLLGVIFIIVMVLLDIFITVIFFVKDFGFLTQGDIILGEIVVLVLCGGVGAARR